jgi:hypothetical protein
MELNVLKKELLAAIDWRLTVRTHPFVSQAFRFHAFRHLLFSCLYEVLLPTS